jgi:hypothetical protein
VNRRTNKRQVSYGSWFVAIVVLVAVCAAAVYLVQKALAPKSTQDNTSSSVPAPASSSAPAKSSSVAPIQHPITQAESSPASESTAPLPALADSDTSVLDALSKLASGGDLHALLAPNQLISRTVATIDALPRHSMGSSFILPLRTPKGTLQTTPGSGVTLISPANAGRYDPYMAVLTSVDPHALVAWYRHNYPLFQQAYRELGYPHGYFNDRLIVAIDDMLAAPDLHDPVAVTKSGSRYLFADPSLQGLSNGQKLMVRMGPANEQQFKAKLRMIRSLLAGGQIAH